MPELSPTAGRALVHELVHRRQLVLQAGPDVLDRLPTTPD